MPTKTEILKAIKQAEVAKLAEQDTHRTIIKAAQATKQHDQQLIEFGWDGILAHMVGESFPPHSTDWKELCGIEWDKTPNVLQLRQIEDEDISFALCMFSELAEHTQRIKAAAAFYQLLGGANPNNNFLFALWQRRIMAREMLGYANSLNVIQQQQLHAWIQAMDVLGSAVVSGGSAAKFLKVAPSSWN